MLMCIQILVKFCPLVLKILSGNEMVTDLRNNGIAELRNSGITEGQGKSNIAPTFSKRGYNDVSCDNTILSYSSANSYII